MTTRKIRGITLEKPNIGDLRKGLGKNKYNWYCWSACESCGKERWVEIIKGGLRNGMCVHCSDRSKQVEAMRRANLGTTRSQETRDRISQTRRQKVWEYAKVPSINPSIGDKAKVNRHSCIWFACSMCGKERWIRVKRGGIPSHVICNGCVTDEKRNKLRLANLGRKDSPERVEANRLTHIGQIVSEEKRERARQLWQNPKWRKWAIMQQRRFVCPNKPETTLAQLLEYLYPKEWKFVGDGSLIINGYNPDFANINGKKQLIEMWGDYWHKGQNPEKRIAIFNKFGYRTLVIWERELKDEALLIQRIQEFVG